MTDEEINAKLASLPEPEFLNPDWPDYAALGFGDEDVEHLLDLTADFYLNFEQSDEESAASIHAWRALALRGDLELLPEFLSLLMETDDIEDDWFVEDFPRLVSYMGMPALPNLLDALELHSDYQCVTSGILEALPKLSQDPAEQKVIKEALANLLTNEVISREGKGMAVNGLIEMNDKDHHEQIKEAYQTNKVDLTIAGDLEEVEISLGIRTKRSSPKPHFFALETKLAVQERRDTLGEFPADASTESQMQYFLSLYEQDSSINRIDTLDGFLLSASLCRIPLSKVAHFVWDLSGEARDIARLFETKKEFEKWHSLLRTLYSRTEESLREGEYQPTLLVWPDADESLDPETPFLTPWVEGFMQGEMVFNENPTKEELFEIARLTETVFEVEGEGTRLLEDAEDNPMYQFMGYIVKRHAEDRFSKESPGKAGKGKIDRNAPCPCGSGQKYKKCCLN
ncbi:SEC-C metal-binding domain-containing protein [Roseibacillus persicicus]|uniref:SEC-C metal-binding domain-containing protein n=1 Tax=Roseibacillus persicicus TaxID=454148 RepID=UPI00280F7919|nr:SEC-C metal-binding domain-containing protein [Roseibacillus persicicus]MDQ8191590.1 UPF0149 family protein [Roseibacillus persicicus]